MAKAKFTRQDADTALKLMVERLTARDYVKGPGEYAFTAGYLQSMLAGIIAELPAAKQIDVIRMINAVE